MLVCAAVASSPNLRGSCRALTHNPIFPLFQRTFLPSLTSALCNNCPYSENCHCRCVANKITEESNIQKISQTFTLSRALNQPVSKGENVFTGDQHWSPCPVTAIEKSSFTGRPLSRFRETRIHLRYCE